MYYLPLFINDSRMHILHLQSQDDFQSRIIPSFIVVNKNDYSLFSIPTENPQMICDNADNVNLREVNFELSKADSLILSTKYRNLPRYLLEIKADGEGTCTNNNVDNMYFDGYIGGNPAASDELRITVSSALEENDFILLVKYTHDNIVNGKSRGKREYIDAIRILTIRDEAQELCSASLDFGSEASQIFVKDDKTNLNVKDAFCDIIGKSETERSFLKTKDYYQGRRNDANPELFKSIYHIHTAPGSTFLGDLPMNNKEKTFVQTLLPVDYLNQGELILLPNLKLIELLNFKINTTSINFADGVDDKICDIANPSLGTRKVQDGILRMILSNFLSVILYNRRAINATNKKCLLFTLLVPNVYYQDKVARIIDNLYEDFDLLLQKHPDLFSSWRGIEVKILSESDASYFGIRHENEARGYKKGAYSLVIDAGKGTTDFSLLHQQGECLSNFECIYRSGIPASGHVLTYAVFEALQNCFAEINLSDKLNNYIQNTQEGRNAASLISLVDQLEEQKIKMEKFTEASIEQIQEIAKDLEKFDDIIGMLVDMNQQGIFIPKLNDFINKKIELLLKLMDNTIFSYTADRKIQLYNVFLTGRAFELKIFREAVTNALIKEGLIQNAEQVIFESELAKSACVKGAVEGRSFIINNKSTMLGTPSMVENVGTISCRKQKLRHFFGKDKIIMANVNNDFFYSGIKKGNVTNVLIDICGRTYMGPGYETAEDTYLYFLGDRYLLKHGSRNDIIEERVTPTSIGDVKTSQELAEQSLFPFLINMNSFSHQSKPIAKATPTEENKQEAEKENKPAATDEDSQTKNIGNNNYDD